MAFATKNTALLVKMKRDQIDTGALKQARQYATTLKSYCPDHQIRSFLVGQRYDTLKELSAEAIEDYSV